MVKVLIDIVYRDNVVSTRYHKIWYQSDSKKTLTHHIGDRFRHTLFNVSLSRKARTCDLRFTWRALTKYYWLELDCLAYNCEHFSFALLELA